MSLETDMLSKVVNRQDFLECFRVRIISFQVDIKISRDQGGVRKGAGKREQVLKFFKEFGHSEAGGAVETNKVEICLNEVHQSNDMYKSIELGGGDNRGLKLIVH